MVNLFARFDDLARWWGGCRVIGNWSLVICRWNGRASKTGQAFCNIGRQRRLAILIARIFRQVQFAGWRRSIIRRIRHIWWSGLRMRRNIRLSAWR